MAPQAIDKERFIEDAKTAEDARRTRTEDSDRGKFAAALAPLLNSDPDLDAIECIYWDRRRAFGEYVYRTAGMRFKMRPSLDHSVFLGAPFFSVPIGCRADIPAAQASVRRQKAMAVSILVFWALFLIFCLALGN